MKNFSIWATAPGTSTSVKCDIEDEYVKTVDNLTFVRWAPDNIDIDYKELLKPSIIEASDINTQEEALQYINNYLTIKSINTLDILNRSVLPHVGNEPKNKAFFLESSLEQKYEFENNLDSILLPLEVLPLNDKPNEFIIDPVLYDYAMDNTTFYIPCQSSEDSECTEIIHGFEFGQEDNFFRLHNEPDIEESINYNDFKFHFKDFGNDRIPDNLEMGYNPDPANDDYHQVKNPSGTEGNNLRDEFNLEGVPLRLMFKNSNNPYIQDS